MIIPEKDFYSWNAKYEISILQYLIKYTTVQKFEVGQILLMFLKEMYYVSRLQLFDKKKYSTNS